MLHECEELQDLIAYLHNFEIPLGNKLARQVIVESDQYIIKDNTIYHRYQRKSRSKDDQNKIIKQLVVPSQLRLEIIQSYHDNISHAGNT